MANGATNCPSMWTETTFTDNLPLLAADHLGSLVCISFLICFWTDAPDFIISSKTRVSHCPLSGILKFQGSMEQCNGHILCDNDDDIKLS